MRYLKWIVPVFIIAFCFLGFLIAPHDPEAMDIVNKYAPFSADSPLGTDQFGRCELSRLLHGGCVTLGIVLLGASIVKRLRWVKSERRHIWRQKRQHGGKRKPCLSKSQRWDWYWSRPSLQTATRMGLPLDCNPIWTRNSLQKISLTAYWSRCWCFLVSGLRFVGSFRMSLSGYGRWLLDK